jgi:predicted dehydrogenase
VSTPNQFHCEHVITAARGGKHVVVEKPMALSIEQCERMVEEVERHGVQLLCGHTQSFNPAIRAMRQVIKSGQLGPLRALNTWMYTDWMLRPRMPQELDLSLGGGVVYRQGPHQIDTLRLLGGGMVRSVRAQTGQWMPERPAPGYYSAFLEFEDGTPAEALHAVQGAPAAPGLARHAGGGARVGAGDEGDAGHLLHGGQDLGAGHAEAGNGHFQDAGRRLGDLGQVSLGHRLPPWRWGRVAPLD